MATLSDTKRMCLCGDSLTEHRHVPDYSVIKERYVFTDASTSEVFADMVCPKQKEISVR